MADTFTLPGNTTVIGTDEVTIGGTLQHVQRVKLVDGTDGGTDLLAGDATFGLDVDVTRVAHASTKSATVQATIAGFVAIILTGRTGRRSMTIHNTGSTNTLYVAPANTVTPSTGYAVPPGGVFTDTWSAPDAWYGVCDTGVATTFRTLEIY